MSLRLVLRVVAVAIAVAAVVDPAVTTTRPVDVEVAVVDAGAPELSEAVAEALGQEMTVVRGPFAAADATVVVGTAVPDRAAALGGPGFAVMPADDASRRLAIGSVAAAERAAPGARVPVTVTVSGPADASIEVRLSQDGLVTDQTTVEPGSVIRHVELSFVPAGAGPARVRVEARVDDDAASADLVIDVRPERWRVLFYDTRPSWSSTFVRRALAPDARFDVTSRVVTSRDVSLDIGGAPAGLGNQDALSEFHVVVAGAATALSEADWRGLEAFARGRGGTVVASLDQAPAGGRLDGIVDAGGWRDVSAPGPLAVSTRPLIGRGLAAAELTWPVALPPLARVIATSEPAGADASAPVVWSMPLGAGQLIVSGVLDGWRYRAGSGDAFDAFWRGAVAEAAARAWPPIAIRPGAMAMQPGARLEVDVLIRDLALGAGASGQPASGTVRAWLQAAEGGDARWPVPLRAARGVGALSATVAAPAAPGAYVLTVESGEAVATAAVEVFPEATTPVADDRAWLAAWAQSRGGAVVGAAEVAGLATAVLEAIDVPAEPVDWHPMRSAWWLVPFGVCLGVEWWLRRRTGLL